MRINRRLLLLGLGVGILSLGIHACGDDTPTNSNQNQIENTLTVLREGGSQIVLGSSLALCCGPWESGFDERPTLKILFYDPDQTLSGLRLGLPFETVSAGTVLTLPSDGIERNFSLFLFDADTENEVSSSLGDASGSLSVEVFDCGPPLRIEFTLDATLASEFHMGETVRITGSFKATIFSNPAPFGCDFAP